MRLEKQFNVFGPVDRAARIAARDQTLTRLFADSQTEIVERSGNRTTLRIQYSALGREGVATFDFTFLPEGTVVFEKLCDGNVWRELSGQVTFSQQGTDTEVTIAMTGHTKTLVPEFTIRIPMREHIGQMADTLRECIENADDRGE